MNVIEERGQSVVVEYEDRRGYIRRRIVPRDFKQKDLRLGVPVGVDTEQLDWFRVRRDLNNLLLQKELITLEDVQNNQQDFMWCITASLKKQLLRLYKEQNNA